MIAFTPEPSINASNISTPNHLNGIDVMSSIQMLLVQDYDDQLRFLSNQIKGATRIKKAYRTEIESLQNVLSQKTEKINKRDCVLLSPEQYEQANNHQEFFLDSKDQKQEMQASTTPANLAKQKTKYTKTHQIEGYYVERDALEKQIENYKSKLDSLNEQSELMSLNVQSLTNQRKIAFETISNLVNKQHEALDAIVRNIKS